MVNSFILFISCCLFAQDFVYPEGISYPVGGSGQERFVLIEVHYDNPNSMAGMGA